MILRDLFAKSSCLVGETRSIYFQYVLVIYEVAINAEFMEAKLGHEIKRISFEYPVLLILFNSSQRKRWVRMHTRFTKFYEGENPEKQQMQVYFKNRKREKISEFY